MAAIRLNITITTHNGKPCVFLRRKILDLNVIKPIIQAAYNDRIITVLPQFKDKLQSTASMREKGIIYYNNKKKKWQFTV
jgi:hypothetical protein